ncbi:MAG: M23 family metallopeptidase [Acidobacteria bacterium]|nr:M23 family metallopeptidase [Acidobacteriota bacterium]
MVPFSERRDTPQRLVQITLDQVEVVERFAPGFFEHPDQRYADQPFGIGLMTVPRTIYKENDGLFGSINQESWFFHVVVSETYGRSLTPTHASLKYYSGEELLETRTLNKPSLSGLSGVRFATAAGLDEVFDLRFQCSFMTEPPVDKMQVDLTLVAHDGTTLNESLEVTLSRYEPKTELWFPLEGYFVILAGGDFNEHHAQEWSQHHALDILALGPDRQLVSGYAATNQDFVSWGREVLAPADGVVVYTRNDVPDNANPPRVDKESLNKLPDPLWRVGGNSVVIDHGNGEFSFLAHMQQGSVRVAMGEVVKRGQVLGLLGNSGNSSAPHLHYHLMAGDTLFRSDPIPLRFKNVFFDGVAKGFATGPLKRGVYLRANWQ